MVICLKILNAVLIINLNYFVAPLPNIVIVNNKPTKYNRKEDFTGIITVLETDRPINNDRDFQSENYSKKKFQKISEKSNIFKTSNFVTNSNFRGGLLTKHNFTLHLPVNHEHVINSDRYENTKFSNNYYQSTKAPSIMTTTHEPFILKPEIVSAIIYSNDLISSTNAQDNASSSTHKHKKKTTKHKRPVEENPIQTEHSTLTAPAIATPLIISVPTSSKTSKTKKKKDNISTTLAPESNDFREHFIQNLDYFRKILNLNCSLNAGPRNDTKKVFTTIDGDSEEVTPKPNNKRKYKDKKKYKKKKHQSYHGYKESNELQEHDEKPKKQVQQESHKIPTKYSHVHSHQHQIHPTSISLPINRITAPSNLIPVVPTEIDYFGTRHKVQPLSDDYEEEVGSMFGTVYRAIENAFTTNKDYQEESVDYESKDYQHEESESDSDYSENESEGEENDDESYSDDYKRRRKKRDLLERKNDLKPKVSPGKSFETHIIITTAYDATLDKPQVISHKPTNKINNKKQKINAKKESSSEEYDIIERFRDNFNSFFNEYDSDEDLSTPNKHINGSKKIKDIKEHDDDETPTNFITDGLQSIFSYISDMFPSFFINSSDDKTKDEGKRTKRNNYGGETLSERTIDMTTEKPESQFKRPKRENEKLPWYFPSFLSYTHNDAGFTEQMSSSLKKRHLNESNNEKHGDMREFERIKEKLKAETTTQRNKLDETTARAAPYDFFGMISDLMVTRKKQPKSIATRKNRKKTYNNNQLWRLFPASKDDIKYLNEFRFSEDGMKVHWLKSPVMKDTVDVVVPPNYTETFEEFLSEGEIKYIVKIRNIQHAIKYENPRLNKRDQIELELMNGHPLTWYRYHTFRDIQMYYDYLKRKYPTFIELIQIGWSFSGKPLTIVKVSYPKQTLYDVKKPAIFILSGTSAHIWLPIACSTYILNSIVTNIASNDTYGSMLRKFDWYVLSLLNPDGYDYAMTADRLWQKSRSHQFVSTDDTFISSALNWFRSANVNQTEKVCYGVDMTRNFDANWIDDRSSGVNKCTDYYKGAHPSSEPEIKLLSNFLLKHNKSIQLFINLDGYGQQLLFPLTKLKKDGIDELNDMARSGLRNVKMHRNADKKYRINKKNVDMSSGTVESFAMNKAKIKYSYRIESVDNRQYSIFAPATSIEQNANEILDIIKGMIKYLENE